MSMETRLALVILAVEDLPRARAFYQRAFGWTLAVDEAVYVELHLPDRQRLGLYDRRGYQRNVGQAPVAVPAGGISGAELYFHTEDVASTIARVEAAGGRLLSALAARDWGDEAAYYADPDGNVIVVARPIQGGSTPAI
jgi:predicted enzyme related to lactoylglutathione lyase